MKLFDDWYAERLNPPTLCRRDFGEEAYLAGMLQCVQIFGSVVGCDSCAKTLKGEINEDNRSD